MGHLPTTTHLCDVWEPTEAEDAEDNPVDSTMTLTQADIPAFVSELSDEQKAYLSLEVGKQALQVSLDGLTGIDPTVEPSMHSTLVLKLEIDPTDRMYCAPVADPRRHIDPEGKGVHHYTIKAQQVERARAEVRVAYGD